MLTRTELRAQLNNSTNEHFASGIPLSKTSYNDAEANCIHLQALISFNELMYVDELLSFINASNTNISTTSIKDKMKYLYKVNAVYRTKFNRDLAISIANALNSKSSIGRNQAINTLLQSTLYELSCVE